MSKELFYRWVGDDLELEVHAQPGARQTEPQGLHDGRLKLRIQARAVEGAANEALLAFLAERLQVPVRRCVLVSGQASRRKRVRVTQPGRAVAERMLRDWSLDQKSS